ncbi:GntR family transcriptional regulator [Castellaniella sp. GW247-6E4]|uniref:GntR family transcriptional regulator n=1 Tax=Castellaniella sp. GW247-6E4 TaxID=3140380 RepID=UPI003315A5D8
MPALNIRVAKEQEHSSQPTSRVRPLDDFEKIFKPSTLSLSSPIPLYAQLAAHLSTYITSLGEYGIGCPLPSEKECIRIFDVSRPTVRQAIAELTAQGLVRKERGRGTFICEPRIVHDITHIFENDMRAAQKAVAFKLLEHGEVPVPPHLLSTFGDDAQRLYRVLRLRLVAGRVIGVEERFLPILFKRHLTQKVLMESNVFAILRLFTRADKIASDNAVRSVILDTGQAALIGAPERSAALIRETTYFTDKNTPVMYGVVTFLADLYQLRFQSTIELRRQPSEETHHE